MGCEVLLKETKIEQIEKKIGWGTGWRKKNTYSAAVTGGIIKRNVMMYV